MPKRTIPASRGAPPLVVTTGRWPKEDHEFSQDLNPVLPKDNPVGGTREGPLPLFTISQMPRQKRGKYRWPAQHTYGRVDVVPGYGTESESGHRGR